MSGASQKFEHIEENINAFIKLIDSSQNIRRYLKYMSNNPLEISTSQPDITTSLIYSSIILSPFDENVLTNAECRLFLNIFNSDLKGKPVGKQVYSCDIIVPICYWNLKGTGKIRPIRIAAELSKLFDGKNITGIGDVEITNFKAGKLSNGDYGFLSLFIEVGTSTMNKKY